MLWHACVESRSILMSRLLRACVELPKIDFFLLFYSLLSSVKSWGTQAKTYSTVYKHKNTCKKVIHGKDT
jgi:hypothetical protein